MQLMEPYLYKYHHLVCDNYFTSPALCSTLFDKDTYMTGTVRVYRKGMPKSLKGLKLQRGGVIATQNARGVEIQIPAVNCMYNQKMGGVDLSDKSLELYDPDIRSNKMWKRILFNLLLRVISNAYIIYRQNRGLRTKLNRIDFQMGVCLGLVGNFRQPRRLVGRPRLYTQARLTERHFIEQLDGRKRKVCLICKSKVRTWCSSCSVGLCMKCFITFHTTRQYEE